MHLQSIWLIFWSKRKTRQAGKVTKKTGEKRMFFKQKKQAGTYDTETKKPMIKASICNGEQVAGFKDLKTGAFEEVMLIRNGAELEEFKARYGISGEVEKFY